MAFLKKEKCFYSFNTAVLAVVSMYVKIEKPYRVAADVADDDDLLAGRDLPHGPHLLLQAPVVVVASVGVARVVDPRRLDVEAAVALVDCEAVGAEDVEDRIVSHTEQFGHLKLFPRPKPKCIT